MKSREKKLEWLRFWPVLFMSLIFSVGIFLTLSHAEEDGGVPKYWSTSPQFNWVEDIDTSAGKLKVNVNGALLSASSLTQNVYKKSNHLRLDLKPKQNLIEISQAGVTLYNADIFYAPSYEALLVPEEYESTIFHTIENENKCLACHQMEPTEVDKAPSPINKSTCFPCHEETFKTLTTLHKLDLSKWGCLNCHEGQVKQMDFTDLEARYTIKGDMGVGVLCFQCHKKKSEEFDAAAFIHGPVGAYQCNMCHNPHGTVRDKLMQDDTTTICVGCHELEKVAGMGEKVLHKAITKKGCLGCHRPHFGDNKQFHRLQGDALCYKCHEKMAPLATKKYPHVKGCIVCHDPHASPASFRLRTSLDPDTGVYTVVEKPVTENCLKCHRERDPVAIQRAENSKVKHEPVVKGQCTKCHSPHATDFPKQLNTPMKETCFGCHKKMRKLFANNEVKHKPAEENECAACHFVHGSELPRLLNANFSNEFYAPFEIKNFELCFSNKCHLEEMVLDRKTEKTKFRNGQENLHFVHVNNRKKGRNCISCHEIHASHQKGRIREKIPFKKRFSISLKFTKTETGGGCVVGCHNPKKYDREKPVRKK